VRKSPGFLGPEHVPLENPMVELLFLVSIYFLDGDVTCHQSDFNLPSLDSVSLPLQHAFSVACL